MPCWMSQMWGASVSLLLELSDRTQFILVTHNRNTVQAANVIYGVTMGRDFSQPGDQPASG